MTEIKPAEIVGSLLKILGPLSSDDRHRYIKASLVLLDDEPLKATHKEHAASDTEQNSSELPTKAKLWAKQNSVSDDQIWHSFHAAESGVEIIAGEIPGQSNKDKVRNIYVLTGLSNMLRDGSAAFDDASARAICDRYGVYDTNHSKYLKGGNEFTGSTKSGWTVTAPGLKRAAILVKELSPPND